MQRLRETHGGQSKIRLSGRDHRHYRFRRERALTFFNIGWRNDFVMRWWSALAIGWPIAASTAISRSPSPATSPSASSPPSKGPEQLLAGRLDVVFARRRTDAWLMVDCVRLSRSAGAMGAPAFTHGNKGPQTPA